MNRAGRRPIVNAIFLMLAIPLLSNCALMSPPKTEPKKEVLSKLPPELPQQKSQAASVLVFPPETQAIYDTIKWRTSASTNGARRRRRCCSPCWFEPCRTPIASTRC